MEELWSNIHVSSLHQNQPTINPGGVPPPDPCSTNSVSLHPPEVAVSLTLSSTSSRAAQLDHHHHLKTPGHDHKDNDKGEEDGILVGSSRLEELVMSTPCFFSSLNSPFEGLAKGSASSSSCFPSLLLTSLCSGNKRGGEDLNTNRDSKGDRRYKRMMKNRESAARSRARRQAYTSELEREVADLMEENAKLREEQEKLLPYAPAEIPKKPTHTRSLTAPF